MNDQGEKQALGLTEEGREEIGKFGWPHISVLKINTVAYLQIKSAYFLPKKHMQNVEYICETSTYATENSRILDYKMICENSRICDKNLAAFAT